MRLVYVGGAHGVGKTTVLKELDASGMLSKNEYHIVYGSQLVAQIAKQRFSFDWSAELDVSRQTQKIEDVRKYAVEYIAQLPYSLVILDSHYVDMSSGVARCIVSNRLKSLINRHIIIDAPPKMIIERRVSDATKKRNMDMDALYKEAYNEKRTAIIIAAETRTPIHVLQNMEIVKTSEKLCSLLRV